MRKPFSMKLLLARIAAVLRRDQVSHEQREVVSAGPVVLDRGRHLALVNGQPMPVTATEFRILAALISAGGRVLTRKHLIDMTLGRGAAVTDRTIDVHIAALRRKLGPAAGCIQCISPRLSLEIGCPIA